MHTSPPGAADLPALAGVLAAQLLPAAPSAPTDPAVQLTALRQAWLGRCAGLTELSHL